MFNPDFLLEQNLRLREENSALEDMNEALTHILSCILPELGTVRVPRNMNIPRPGKIEFRSAPRNCVDIVFVEDPRFTSRTGDPIYDRIFYR